MRTEFKLETNKKNTARNWYNLALAYKKRRPQRIRNAGLPTDSIEITQNNTAMGQ